MTFSEIESLAQKGETPQKMSSHEQLAFDCMSILYNSFQNGLITMEQFESQKRMFMKDYDICTSDHNCCVRAYKEYQDNIRRSGSLREEINRDKRAGVDASTILPKALECIKRMCGQAS